ncbi:Protein of unknown function [Cotesia congregata]|uniref:Uncharacterized protein n=1 Tax=Cotesia congregata TaxID=51543 RepID=A0A8J2MRB5_COTCN|nr:Protein of unknown function [Cotesia congregata]
MSIAVNKIASESQAKMRRHKIIILPITKDIQKLIIHIKITKKNCFDILKERFDYHTWLAASKLVAAYLLVFNRRRVGDVQNMVISDMDRLQSIDEQADKEEYNALDDDGKKIAANYYRIEIRGKLNKDVAVIVSNDIVDEIKLLIRYRESANVPTDNDFVFEIPNETEILFDHNLPCTSSAHNSVVITDYAQMLNQSTPKDRQSTITVSETCKSTKKPWSDEEKKVIFTEFKEYIISRTHPPLKDIDDVKAKYPCLNGRSRDTVKAWINNHYKKKPSNVLNKKKGIKIISVKNKNYNLKRLTKKSLDL